VSLLRQLLIIACLSVVLSPCSTSAAKSTPDSTVFSQPWISGLSENEPPLQAQEYDSNTLVMRQSLRTSFEAPFIYLLFGDEKALLIDSGAGNVDLRSMVDKRIEAWLEDTGRENIALVVMHTHAHGDHVAGDEQFIDRADTAIVGHEVEDVVDFFNVGNWPNESKAFDLGGRIVDIIPTPGHHDTHVMVYDRSTRLLFSGDMLYPGRLYFQCGKAELFRNSIDRVAEFVKKRDTSWVLGAHIELAQKSGKSFGSNDLVRPDERLLEMSPATITAVKSALHQMGDRPRVEAYDDFILFPHPADPRGKKPPNWCQTGDSEN
jgi:glyoxylase-like metal-dependent hydrolase (beta-lactamase superfamily II)